MQSFACDVLLDYIFILLALPYCHHAELKPHVTVSGGCAGSGRIPHCRCKGIFSNGTQVTAYRDISGWNRGAAGPVSRLLKQFQTELESHQSSTREVSKVSGIYTAYLTSEITSELFVLLHIPEGSNRFKKGKSNMRLLYDLLTSGAVGATAQQ